MSLREQFEKIMAEGHDSAPETDDSVQKAIVVRAILAGCGFQRHWVCSSKLGFSIADNLPPDVEKAIEAEFDRLNTIYKADILAVAKRIGGQYVLTESEVDAMVGAALNAAKAQRPTS